MSAKRVFSILVWIFGFIAVVAFAFIILVTVLIPWWTLIANRYFPY